MCWDIGTCEDMWNTCAGTCVRTWGTHVCRDTYEDLGDLHVQGHVCEDLQDTCVMPWLTHVFRDVVGTRVQRHGGRVWWDIGTCEDLGNTCVQGHVCEELGHTCVQEQGGDTCAGTWGHVQ